MQSLGLNQIQFANGLGMTQANVSRMLNGKTQLTKIVAFLIEKTYGISSEWLLYGTGEMYIALSEEEKKVQELNSLLRQLERKPEIKEILEVLLRADSKELKKVKEVVKALVEE